MTLKERLEAMAADPDYGLTSMDCRKVLALLKASKDFHGWFQGGDDDSFYAARDTLLIAINAMEAES